VHQPPDSKWLQRFRGAVVEAITLCRYQITLVFEDARHITFSAPFRFGPSTDTPSEDWLEFPLRESPMPRVLGASITDIRTDAENELWNRLFLQRHTCCRVDAYV
jgi:hypothetical protein